jgi:hypothetical protein
MLTAYQVHAAAETSTPVQIGQDRTRGAPSSASRVGAYASHAASPRTPAKMPSTLTVYASGPNSNGSPP